MALRVKFLIMTPGDSLGEFDRTDHVPLEPLLDISNACTCSSRCVCFLPLRFKLRTCYSVIKVSTSVNETEAPGQRKLTADDSDNIDKRPGRQAVQ